MKGLEKVKVEWTLASIAYNLTRMWRSNRPARRKAILTPRTAKQKPPSPITTPATKIKKRSPHTDSSNRPSQPYVVAELQIGPSDPPPV